MQTDFRRKVPRYQLRSKTCLISARRNLGRGGWISFFQSNFRERQKKASRFSDFLRKFYRFSVCHRDSLRVHGDFIGIGAQVLMGVKDYSEKDT